MRLFLDANVLFSAGYRVESPLLALWALHDVEVLRTRGLVSLAARGRAVRHGAVAGGKEWRPQ